jgi:hypothetical protein
MSKTYKINYSWRSTYFQVLQLTQAFFTNPETPNMAAILCLLSRGNNLVDSQRELRKWLYNYISPFALNPVRDEQNLEEKTLAIAVYFLLEENDQHDEWILPDEQLINYVEYAEKQFWFDDPFLAFVCHQLKDRLTCCEKIDTYFQSKYELFLQKKHIPSISQALIVLQNSVSSVDIQRGYETITSMLERTNLPSKHLAWALWAYSKQPRRYHESITNVNLLLEKEIVQLLHEVQWESGLSSTLAFALISKGGSSPDDYLDKMNQTFGESIEVRQNGNNYSLSIKPKTTSDGVMLSISDLTLILVALHQSKFNKIAYVDGLQEEELPILESSLDALFHGNIVLSKVEKIVVNFLVMLFTLQLVLLALYLQMGLPSKLSDVEFKWDYLVTLGVWLDIFIAQLRSALSGGNAIDSLKETLILRGLFSRFSKPKKQGIDNGE